MNRIIFFFACWIVATPIALSANEPKNFFLEEQAANRASIASLLETLAGKDVILYLKSGKQIRGTLSSQKREGISAEYVYLTSVWGSEAWGVLIEFNEIVGVGFINRPGAKR